MNEIEKQAAFYRGYLADDKGLARVAGVLVTAVAAWLFFYLVSLVGPQPQPAGPSALSSWSSGYADAAARARRYQELSAKR